MKIKPVLVGFSREEGSMLSFVLIKTRNAPIPSMKIRQIEYITGFLNTSGGKIRCSLNPKAQVVNKAQRPPPYFPEFFKSRAQGLRGGITTVKIKKGI